MSQTSQVTISSSGVILVKSSHDTDDTGELLPLIAAKSHEQSHISVNDFNPDSLLRIRDIAAPHYGYIRVLELNRPSTRNAISRALLSELKREIDAIRKQFDSRIRQEKPFQDGSEGFMRQNGATRALIIASAVDSCFCSGADLKERKEFTPEQTEEFLTNLRETFTALSQLPVPTISAIGSLALGGGFELALSTHFRVVSSNATMGLTETRLGIIPGAGGTYRLSALIGVSQARKLVLTGRKITGVEAYRLGIADHLVDLSMASQSNELGMGPDQLEKDRSILCEVRNEVLAEAVKLAEEICEGGPIAIEAAIQAFQDGPNADTEKAMYKRAMNTEDRNEALRAFAEKRKPVFRGR